MVFAGYSGFLHYLQLARISHNWHKCDEKQNSNSNSPTMPDIQISVEGVLKLLKNLKPNKASGSDNIGPRVLKELADIIADPLTRIFRRSLRDGQVPRDWKHTRIAPIFKKGQKYDPANYRPISLTCVTSKLMEHIICSNLMEHASQNNILYSLQHGFRERRSCEMQFIEFVNDVVSSMQDSLQTDVCVLDFSKAFDKVGHQRLLHKLRVVRRQRHHKPVDPKPPRGQDTVCCC